MGLPAVSCSSRFKALSPARGGSGSIDSRTSMSPAWTASESSFFLAQETRTSAARPRLAMFFMSALRGVLDAQVGPDRALQVGEALLVHGEMGREIELVHAQLARAVDHHGEVGAAGSV